MESGRGEWSRSELEECGAHLRESGIDLGVAGAVFELLWVFSHVKEQLAEIAISPKVRPVLGDQ